MLIWLGKNILGQTDGKSAENGGGTTVIIEWDI